MTQNVWKRLVRNQKVEYVWKKHAWKYLTSFKEWLTLYGQNFSHFFSQNKTYLVKNSDLRPYIFQFMNLSTRNKKIRKIFPLNKWSAGQFPSKFNVLPFFLKPFYSARIRDFFISFIQITKMRKFVLYGAGLWLDSFLNIGPNF